MQRLFSTFADGWPGRGLLLQRVLTGAALIHCAIVYVTAPSHVVSIVPQIIAACGGILLLVGLWTPLVGALVAILELWIAFSYPGDPWNRVMLAALCASLAMVGPGAWSIDARLFGRKRIHTPDL